ncbi:hypothetical protein [Alsobacter sp. SYSU BS001988]|jgi:hypothetical protein
MCEGCEGADDPDEGGPPSPELVAFARDLERRLEGEPASERAWAIFLGREGGALAWAPFVRMSGCMDEAARHWSFAHLKPRTVARCTLRADAPS